MPEKLMDFDARRRHAYAAWVDIPVRFGDQDVMGHVNNAMIATYFEHARCTLIIPRILPSARSELNIVLARVTIDYVREIRFPGTVELGARVTRIGTKSFTISSAAFIGETCHATAEATLVFFNTASRAAMAPSADVRERLELLLK